LAKEIFDYLDISLMKYMTDGCITTT